MSASLRKSLLVAIASAAVLGVCTVSASALPYRFGKTQYAGGTRVIPNVAYSRSAVVRPNVVGARGTSFAAANPAGHTGQYGAVKYAAGARVIPNVVYSRNAVVRPNYVAARGTSFAAANPAGHSGQYGAVKYAAGAKVIPNVVYAPGARVTHNAVYAGNAVKTPFGVAAAGSSYANSCTPQRTPWGIICR